MLNPIGSGEIAQSFIPQFPEVLHIIVLQEARSFHDHLIQQSAKLHIGHQALAARDRL
jgi:hypothetical protein